ncbi:MAG: GTPase HflX [Oscillospiraceae bacterium]|nr:GTPase HflX [Oscillospiraceae bacterium]
MTKVILLAADLGEYDIERSMSELRALAESAGMEPVAEVVQKKAAIEKATYLGEGRLAEARLLAYNLQAELAIFDCELSGSQIRNLEQILEVPVIDRTMLILEIFASRATTNEGKLQTELATLRYRLPRLQGLGTSLGRQGGGGEGGGGGRRGAGESKLEYDKRHIRRRIDALSENLAEMEKRRAETRKSRAKNGVPVIALVGYTNVGKSSLLNRLCGAEVMAADMLFATLDPTARKFTLPSGQNAIFIDTVGFVSRLPHNLVEAFKSTLEEARYADIILKVCDLADEEAAAQLEVTDQVLQQIGCAEITQLTVYNKCDCVQTNAMLFDKNAIQVSAATGEGLDALVQLLDEKLADRVRNIEVLLPYDKLAAATPMRERGTVLQEEYRDGGLYLKGIVKKEDFHYFESYLL